MYLGVQVGNLFDNSKKTCFEMIKNKITVEKGNFTKKFPFFTELLRANYCNFIMKRLSYT